MPREVGQYAEYCHDRDGDARGQPVEAVGEVGAVRHRRDDEDRHQHVEQPRGGAGFAREPSVVEFVVLDEGDGGFGGLGAFRAQDDVPLHAFDHRSVGVQIDGLHGLRDLLADDDLGRKPHRRADDDAQPDLAHDLKAALEPLLVVAEDLDVVVQPADQPQPDGRDDHQLDVDVVEPSEEQDRDEDRQQDDDAAHRGGAAFLELSLEPEVADVLADLLAAQEVDDLAAEDDDDQQREDDGRRRAERNILEHTRARDVVVFA